METKEYKVGETFQCGFTKLKVEKSNGLCDGCFFDNGIRCFGSKTELEDTGSCIGTEREDKTDVIFVEVEE